MRPSSTVAIEPDPAAWVELKRDSSGPGSLVCLSAYGEFDLATADVLRVPLLRQLLAGCRAIAVDMSGVKFLDVVAVDMLVATQRDFLAAGATLVVTNPSRPVSRLLALAGLDRRLLAAHRAVALDC